MKNVKILWKDFEPRLVELFELIRTHKSSAKDVDKSGKLQDYHLKHIASRLFDDKNNYQLCEIDFVTFCEVILVILLYNILLI